MQLVIVLQINWYFTICLLYTSLCRSTTLFLLTQVVVFRYITDQNKSYQRDLVLFMAPLLRTYLIDQFFII